MVNGAQESSAIRPDLNEEAVSLGRVQDRGGLGSADETR